MRNPKFLGVYSLKTASANGHKPKFFVWLLPDGNYAIQELDASLSQRGPARAVSRSGLEKGFKAEPAILAAPVTTPDFRPLLPQPKDQEAPPRDPKEVENTLRHNFLRAMRAISQPKNKETGMALLERIVRNKEGIVPAHKHMFRDFGVALRKRALPRLALLSAQRAVALSPEDDHARFNLARILGILGRYDEAQAQLDAARKLDPQEEVYNRLHVYLEQERKKSESILHDDED